METDLVCPLGCVFSLGCAGNMLRFQVWTSRVVSFELERGRVGAGNMLRFQVWKSRIISSELERGELRLFFFDTRLNSIFLLVHIDHAKFCCACCCSRDSSSQVQLLDRLESLLDLAIRSSSAADDPFCDDVACLLQNIPLIDQVCVPWRHVLVVTVAF